LRINNNITLVEGNEIISNDSKVANAFSEFFQKAVTNLDIPKTPSNADNSFSKSVDECIEKFAEHESVKKITEKVNFLNNRPDFKFENVSENDILCKINSLNTKKAVPFKSIPGKVIKQCKNIISSKITELFNFHLNEQTCPKSMKLADVHPVFKNGVKTNVKNFRPVSVLSFSSKIFERILHDQISCYINKYLSKNLGGYRKGFSSQHALMAMTEKWQKSLDKKGFTGAVLMDLSKAFDCIDH